MNNPTDDVSIADDASLWRRINPEWIVPDHNRGGKRLSSQAFQNLKGNKLSAFLAELVLSSGREAIDLLRDHPNYALAAISAGVCREHEQIIVRDPLPDEVAHCHVLGRKTKSIKRKLAKAATWEIPPS